MPRDETNTITVALSIKRFDPEQDEAPHWQHFSVRCEPTDRVLDALQKIKDDQDGSLSFRRSCAHGVCGSDAMMINGRNALACKMLIRDAGKNIRIEALRGLPIIKDLIIDMKPFFAQHKSVMPYLIAEDSPTEGERLQTPSERARFDESTKCILCAACTTSCPVYWMNDTYVGPSALVQAHRFVFDSRDTAAAHRLHVLAQNSGAFRCRTSFNCTNACPRDIPVTDIIQELKRAIAHRRTKS